MRFGDFGGGLDPGEAAAANGDRAGGGRGLRQPLREVAGQAGVVERPGVLGRAGDDAGVGGAAEGVDERVVVQGGPAVESDGPRGGVDSGSGGLAITPRR